MKCLLLIPVFLLLGMFAFGQIKVISQGPIFSDDDRVGMQRVLLMKNGQTFYLCLNKESLVIRIYASNFTVKANKKLSPRLGKASSFKIKGLYDMNGDVILLVSAVVEHQLKLQRVIIDGNTGALKDQSIIGELEKVSYFKLGGVAFGDVPDPDFFSEEMPEGNGYAVVAMNSFQPDRSKRIVVSVYGVDNKELSHAFYKSPEERYKYMQYIGMAPMEKNKLGILAYGYNTASSGGKECELIYGTLTTGDTTLEIDKLGSSKRAASFSIASYNTLSKKMLVVEKVEKEGYTSTVVDPYSKTAITKMKLNKDWKDIPRNIFINEDGTFTILYEEYESITNNGPVVASSHAHFGDFSVSVISKDGTKEIANYRAPRNFWPKPEQGYPLSPSASYLSTGENNYLLFNDDVDNIERVQSGKRVHKVTTMDDWNGYYYTLSGKDEVPKVTALFGEPDEKRVHNMGAYAASDYRKETGMYVIVKREERGKDTNWRMVWMKP